MRLFGATIIGTPFVHQRARIEHPWNLTLNHLASLGDRAHVYSLGKISVGTRAIVAQEAYLCTGTHDFSHPVRPLQTAEITIGPDVFLGARCFVMPGVSVGANTIVGACSVLTRSVPPNVLVAGNPAGVIRQLLQPNK